MNKGVAVRDFPRIVQLVNQPPLSLWSTPLFLESGNCKRPIWLLSIWPNNDRFTESHKNESSRKAMLAMHSGIHSWEQNYNQLKAIFISDSKNSNDSYEFQKNSENSESTMEPRTSKSYQEEVLEKYKREKGGEMRGYLAEPTSSQIRDACIYLLHRRDDKNDEYILKRFFQFRDDDNRLREIQNFGIGKFKSIEKFLKGEIKTTSTKNVNLISWLIDFKPRPYEEYLKPDLSTPSQKLTQNEKLPNTQLKQDIKKKGKKRPKLVITISIAFGAVLLTTLALKDSVFNSYSLSPYQRECMTWADSLYITTSCDIGPFSKYGTKIESLHPIKLENFRKVKVNMAYMFFTEEGKPLIWYHKTKEDEIEFFTAPGLHPTNGETLKKITPYIIEKYVPLYSY